MSGRPRDWHPLTEDGADPFPGDWELVQEAAARYRRTADSIMTAKNLLREVTDSRDGWQSDAGEAFREKATEVSDDVFRAYGRYDATANALAEYWPHLRDVQDESLDLRRQAQAAQDELDSLGPRVEAAEDEDSDTHDDHARLQGQLESAQGELNRLRGRLAQLIEEKDAAAQRAADAIGDFIGGDGLTDGFWDRMGAAFTAALNFVGELAGQVAMIAGLAALLLCWVPVLGQALAAVATIATAISLAVNLLQGDWRGVLLDSIGLLTFGIGRAAGAAARAARGLGRHRAVSYIARSTQGTAPLGQRAAQVRALTGIDAGEAMRGYRAARAATDLASQPLNMFGRSIQLGPLGWGRHAFRNLGSDLVGNLRAPFSAGNWGLAGSFRQAVGLTDMGVAGSAMAGAAAATVNRAAMVELGGVALGTGTTLVTLGDGWAPQWNLPDGVPFTDLPGLSVNAESPFSQDAAAVGDFTYQPDEARVQ